MKYFLLTIGVLFSSQAFAANESFYSNRINNGWKTYGDQPADGHARCTTSGDFADGSRIQITKNITTNEFYIMVKNTDWNLTEGKDDKHRVRINFFDKKRLIKGYTFNWAIIDKNTILVDNMKNEVVDVIWKASELRLVMPDNISNFLINMPRLIVIEEIVKCVENYRKWDKKKPLEVNPSTQMMYGKEKI